MPTPFVAPNTANTFGTVLGSACFPAVDGGNTPWLIPNPGSATRLNKANTAIDFGGEFYPDGNRTPTRTPSVNTKPSSSK